MVAIIFRTGTKYACNHYYNGVLAELKITIIYQKMVGYGYGYRTRMVSYGYGYITIITIITILTITIITIL